MGWTRPDFAHVPLIHGPDGAKLSKRHGAASVTDFRDQGYLPEALCNYLLRLGWGHGDAEILDPRRSDRAVRFRRRRPRRQPHGLRQTHHLNGVWLRGADDDRLTGDVVQRLTARGPGRPPPPPPASETC